MTQHLLAISIGPVQELIAAARRTRDLWFGSHLLSEISKAAARALANHSGIGTSGMIFPAPASLDDLRLDSKLNVANVILAGVKDGHEPRDAAKLAETAAQDCWQEFARNARLKAGDCIVPEIWHEQNTDVLEFYAAWSPCPANGYQAARRRVMRLLAGRKNCRNFELGSRRDDRLPKSSLDGARDSVLDQSIFATDERANTRRRPLRLSGKEQLDVLGVVKRVGGGQQSYPSVSRIAADPWLQGIRQAATTRPDVQKQFEVLVRACRELSASDIISLLDEKRWPVYRDYPFDGTSVFLDRIPSMATDAGVEATLFDGLKHAVSSFVRPVSKGGFGFGEPDPYLAVLVADGDRMGAKIADIEDVESHRTFSRQLAEFSIRAKEIVAKHRGTLVYAGGDDVLAFLPTDKCLACAKQLWESFRGEVDGATLSVGVAIAHFMEPLEDLLDYGRKAEKLAKTPDRNGLAVMVRSRGGSPIELRDNWQAGVNSLDERLKEWADLFSERRLPNKLPYDLRQLAIAYKNWLQTEALTTAIAKDVRRLLARKQAQLTEEQRVWIEARLEMLTNAQSLERLAAEMLIAQRIGVAMEQSRGNKTRPSSDEEEAAA